MHTQEIVCKIDFAYFHGGKYDEISKIPFQIDLSNSFMRFVLKFQDKKKKTTVSHIVLHASLFFHCFALRHRCVLFLF